MASRNGSDNRSLCCERRAKTAARRRLADGLVAVDVSVGGGRHQRWATAPRQRPVARCSWLGKREISKRDINKMVVHHPLRVRNCSCRCSTGVAGGGNVGNKTPRRSRGLLFCRPLGHFSQAFFGGYSPCCDGEGPAQPEVTRAIWRPWSIVLQSGVIRAILSECSPCGPAPTVRSGRGRPGRPPPGCSPVVGGGKSRNGGVKVSRCHVRLIYMIVFAG